MENFMRKIQKIATYLLVGSLVFAGRQAMALTTPDEAAGSKTQEASQEAAGSTLKNTTTEIKGETDSGLQTTVVPVAGVDVALDQLYGNTEDVNKKLKQSLSKVSEKKQNNLAFAHVTNYVNIRSKGSEKGEILGKLYDDAAATLISKKKGWYKIKSGSVTGYIKAEFLITGDAADKLSRTVGRRVAEVTTTTLKVREKPSTDATVLTLAAEGDDFKVIKEMSGWVKVYIGGHKTAFLSKDFIKLETVYEEAVSIEEEQENLAEEAAANAQAADNSETQNLGAQNSGTQNSSSHSTSSSSSSSNSSTSSDNSSAGTVSTDSQSASDNSDSSLGSRIASYALQFEGNPYVWGGTSLTN
jgi:SH3-like domain-containing protein